MMFATKLLARKDCVAKRDVLVGMAGLALALTMTACQGRDLKEPRLHAVDEPVASQESAELVQPKVSASLAQAGYTAERLTPPVPEGFEPFIRIDRDDPEAWKGDLANLRVITEGKYEFKTPDEKYGVPDVEPSEDGLDTLNISASAQFSADQFHDLADELRECASGKEIYIIDLRRESHALLDGISFSYYDSYNWSNRGLSLEEIERDQDERFGSLVGSSFTAFPKKSNLPQGEGTEFNPTSYQSEQELVEDEGLHYVRIPVIDHSWPTPQEMDQFVDFVKGIDVDNAWLHFHCHAGTGRTGALTAVYDMMKNPDVSYDDIAIRQAMLGGIYLDYIDHTDAFKEEIYEERQKMGSLFYEYVQKNKDSDYATSWSAWLKAHDA